jgi:hypothetical protein
MKLISKTLAASLIVLMAMQWSGLSHAQQGQKYEVTVTNITGGQLITPPVVISHAGGFGLFELGSPASPQLAELAEDGVTGPLLDHLETMPSVWDFTVASGPLFPGESTTLEVFLIGPFRLISAAGMLADTNDAFFAIRGTLPLRTNEKLVVYANAYDAGSEGNSESCDHIPGPACGSPGVRNTADAEGFVHVHPGIHGVGDLTPYVHDWNNPVAEIVIRRAD